MFIILGTDYWHHPVNEWQLLQISVTRGSHSWHSQLKLHFQEFGFCHCTKSDIGLLAILLVEFIGEGSRLVVNCDPFGWLVAARFVVRTEAVEGCLGRKAKNLSFLMNSKRKSRDGSSDEMPGNDNLFGITNIVRLNRHWFPLIDRSLNKFPSIELEWSALHLWAKHNHCG